ncbi:MAG: acyl-CoA thioesterase [Myxococcaceae bacterium]
MTPESDSFPVVVEIPVAWGEMDAYGHVNNAVYLRWFETARIAYFDRAGVEARMKTERVGPILARAAVDYRRPVTFPDTVRAEVKVTKVGNTSFTMAYRLTSRAQGAIAAEGDTVVVMVDYKSGAKVPLDAGLRSRIEAIEAG